jgi:hypothetical protein
MGRLKRAVDALAPKFAISNGVAWHDTQVEKRFDLKDAKKALDEREAKPIINTQRKTRR